MLLTLNPVDHRMMENYDRTLNGLDYENEDEDELGSLKDFFQKAGSVAKNLISAGSQAMKNYAGGGSAFSPQGTSTAPIIIQNPQQPMQEQPKSNTGLIVGLSALGIGVVGTGIYFATRNRPAINGDETQDLGKAEVVESTSSDSPQPTLNGQRSIKGRRTKLRQHKASIKGFDDLDKTEPAL